MLIFGRTPYILRDEIFHTFIEPGHLLTNSDFQVVTCRYYSAPQPEYTPDEDFTCSSGVIAGVKLCNGISSWKFHYKRWPNLSEEERSAWRDRLANMLSSMDPDRI
jgi:hypothetical protein